MEHRTEHSEASSGCEDACLRSHCCNRSTGLGHCAPYKPVLKHSFNCVDWPSGLRRQDFDRRRRPSSVRVLTATIGEPRRVLASTQPQQPIESQHLQQKAPRDTTHLLTHMVHRREPRTTLRAHTQGMQQRAHSRTHAGHRVLLVSSFAYSAQPVNSAHRKLTGGKSCNRSTGLGHCAPYKPVLKHSFLTVWIV